MWKGLFNSYFVVLGSLASIIGFVLTFLSNQYAVIVALSFFCLSVVLFVIAAIRTLHSLQEKYYPEPYLKISSFFVFETNDGVHSTFETYRMIQSKRTYLSKIDYKYKWTGKIPPEITSNHKVYQLPPNNNPNEFDKAIITLNKPLSYNETAVLQIKTINDDIDGLAQPYLECRLDAPIDIIQFRVLLAYKPDKYSKQAILKRKIISAEISSRYEVLCSVPFQSDYKQYYHIMTNPEPGYFYKLEWEK